MPLNIAQCDDPSNDGCYYDLTPEVKRPDLAAGGVWHHADVSAVDSGGLVRITLTLDGKPVLDATDAGQYGPAYHSGAVGVRGDNTEFYFKNFSVKAV